MLEIIQRLVASRARLLIFSTIFIALSVYLSHPFSSSPLSTSSSTFPKFDPNEDYSYSPISHPHALNQSRPKRVAIVGAGVSGSSAAWFLTRAARVMEDRLGVKTGSLLGEVVVYDSSGYVGGRTTTVHPHGDERLRAVELGASIFVEANRHLVKGAKRFNLNAIDPDFGDSGVGIWDGSQFLYTTSTSKSWWSNWLDTISAIRRYGPMSPLRTTRAVNALLKKFANLYNPVWLHDKGAARSIEEFAERVGLGQEYTTRNGQEWTLGAVKVGEKWMGEIWEGSTRVNYASDMNKIHALGASVSMATGGAKAVEGGNWRIFQAMLNEAKAIVHLATTVTDIVPVNEAGELPRFEVHTNDSSLHTDSETFDQIFYAAPWYSSPKDKGLPGLQANLIQPIHYQKYVRLHVTLLATTRSGPLPSFFGLEPDVKLPTTILTSSYTSRTTPDGSHPPPRFQSITWHGETAPGSGEYTVKIFSLSYLKDDIIRAIIGEEPTWLVRKEWDSYPVLSPTAVFPPVEPVRGVQYLAALEPWVSTMETQTLSAREAVARVVEDWWGLGYGDCRAGAEAWDWSCEE